MLSKQEADVLLKEPKISEVINVDLIADKSILNLYSENDDKLTFKLQINQSNKILFKLTNHHSFNTIGLLRVDFKGRHKNPETVTELVPNSVGKFIGKTFGTNEPHIHIYIEGYDLKWAIPLEEYDFPVKEISSSYDIVSVIKSFQKEINLISKLQFTLPLVR